MQWFPVNDISAWRATSDPHCDTWQPDTDVQLGAIGKTCPVTAGRLRPRSQPLSPSADSPPSLPLITRMPVSHLSAAPTDLGAVASQQLSGFVSATLKAPTAGGQGDAHQWGCCVLSLSLRWKKKKKKKDSSSAAPRRLFVPRPVESLVWVFCGVPTDSFSTKALGVFQIAYLCTQHFILWMHKSAKCAHGKKYEKTQCTFCTNGPKHERGTTDSSLPQPTPYW